MAVLPIYLYGDKVLRETAKPVTELDNETIRLIYDMSETMRKAHGIGLAATQVGELKRVIVIDLSDVEEKEEGSESQGERLVDPAQPRKLVLINPEIIEAVGSWIMEEGCLSIPDVRADVERAERMRVRFRNANFEEMTIEATSLLGRVILHEIDHLDGVLFIDRVGAAKKSLVAAKLRTIKKGEVETSYPVVTAPARKRPTRATWSGGSGGVEV